MTASFSRTVTGFLSAIFLATLLGCQVIGPRAIRYGRLDYNAVIQKTNQEQMFANLIRVYLDQTPAFMDVSEVDAVVISSGTLTGGLNPAGGPTQTGNVAGTLQYEEEPTIRYSPLLGQALVSQVSTPLSVDSLSNMINSGWPISSVLDFACDRLVPDPHDRKDALDAITYLFGTNGLLIGTGQSKAAKPPDGTTTGQPDSLVLFGNTAVLNRDRQASNYWDLLNRIYKPTEDQNKKYEIVLRTVSNQPTDNSQGLQTFSGPVIQTRSALGILRTASQYYHTIIFVPADKYAAYVKLGINHENDPDDPNQRYHDKFYNFGRTLKPPCRPRLVVICSKAPPAARPYVLHFDAPSRMYYYISNDDPLSKENFTLLNLFLTIQSAPAGSPLTPTISVGPGKAGS